jgi:hypothetical protein
MQTMSHLALQPAVNARPMGDFEQSLAKEPLRRVEAKEFIFAEGDPTTFSKLKTLGLIELPHSNRVKLVDIDELESLADGEDH